MPGSSGRPSLLPIYLTVFVDVLALALVYPLLPYYGQSFGASPLVVGLLIASFSFCQLFSGPVLGRLSDRFGRKPILLASQTGTMVGLAVMAAANSIEWLFVGRIIDGITAGNLSIALAYITDETPPEGRTRAYGFFGIAFGVGFLVAPAASGWLAKHYGYAAPPLGAACLSLVSIVLTSAFVPSRRTPISDERPPFFEGIRRIVAQRVPRTRILELFAFVLSFAMLTGGLGLFLARRLSFDVDEVGYAFGFSALMTLIVQGGLGRAAKRLGESRLSAIGIALMIAGYVTLAFADDLVMLGVGLAIGGVGSAVVRPALTTLLTGSVHAEERGLALGVSQSASSLGQALGPAISGWIINRGALAGWALTAAVFAACGLMVRWLGLPSLVSPTPVASAAEPGAEQRD